MMSHDTEINNLHCQDFLCTCDRCQDETENETYMSAIKCTKCQGFFLPENTMGMSMDSFEVEEDNLVYTINV